MKNLKFTLALIIGLAISSNTIQAQTKPAMPEDRKTEMVNQLKLDKEKLALTKDQEASYMEISKKYGEKLKSLRDNDAERSAKMKEVKDLRDQKDAEMKVLLSEDQFKKYKEIQDERKEKMKGRRKR